MMRLPKKARTLRNDLAIILAMSMLLTGCGEGGQEQKITSVTEARMTEADIPVHDPRNEIASEVMIKQTEAKTESGSETVIVTEDDTTEAPTEAQTESQQTDGTYNYTIYGDINIQMDININDWIKNNNLGDPVFFLAQLAYSLNWEKDSQYRYIYYCGALSIVFDIDKIGWTIHPPFDPEYKSDQISCMSVKYVKSEDMTTFSIPLRNVAILGLEELRSIFPRKRIRSHTILHQVTQCSVSRETMQS